MIQEIKFNNKNINNFRDFGGYMTESSQRVKTKIFYRSGALAYIDSQEDLDIFKSLNINTIMDLRSQEERKELPDPDFGIRHYEICGIVDEFGCELNFSPKQILSLSRIKYLNIKNKKSLFDSYFTYFYSRLLFNNKAIQLYFDELLNNHVPILIHCSAGKDRTGVFAALLLLTLGVDIQSVKIDYLNSTFYRKDNIQYYFDKYKGLIKICPPIKRIFYLTQGVIGESFDLFMDLIYDKYDDFYTYIKEEYGIDEDKVKILKELYLEDVNA